MHFQWKISNITVYSRYKLRAYVKLVLWRKFIAFFSMSCRCVWLNVKKYVLILQNCRRIFAEASSSSRRKIAWFYFFSFYHILGKIPSWHTSFLGWRTENWYCFGLWRWRKWSRRYTKGRETQDFSKKSGRARFRIGVGTKPCKQILYLVMGRVFSENLVFGSAQIKAKTRQKYPKIVQF